MELTPGILEKDFNSIQERVKAVEAFVNAVHLDVMDNTFVPNTTFLEGERLPDLLTDLQFDVHLMVNNPEEIVMKWAQPNVRRLIIHQEVCRDGKPNCPSLLDTINMVHDYEKQVGVALNPKTSTQFLKPVIDLIDFILIMTVEPGHSGQAFVADPLKKIVELKKMKSGLKVGVDGGAKKENLAVIKAAGADSVVANSAIYKSDNIPAAIEELKNIIRS